MKPVRILIADDHEIVREGVRTVLESQAGWVVCGEASTGREAVAKAVELRPDIVVLDISMPELNGLQVLEPLKADRHLRDLPEIVTSVIDGLDNVVRCIELGADD